MTGAQLDVEGREVPAMAVDAPPLPSIPAPKSAKALAPLPELSGQLGIPLIPEVSSHDPTATLF